MDRNIISTVPNLHTNFVVLKHKPHIGPSFEGNRSSMAQTPYHFNVEIQQVVEIFPRFRDYFMLQSR